MRSARRLGGRRRALLILAGAGLLAVGAVLLIGQLAGYDRMLAALREADWAWFPLCLAGQVAAYLGYFLVYRDIAALDGGPRLRLRLVARVVIASVGATRLAAAGGAGGLAVYYWSLRRARLGVHQAIVRVLAMNTLLYLVFGLLAAVCGAVALASGVAPAAMAVPWMAGVAACLAAAAVVSAPRTASRLTDAEGRGRPRRLFADAVGGVVVVRRMALRPRAHRSSLFGAGLYWGGDLACLWAALRAFDVQVPVVGMILAYCTAYLVTLLPLPTGAEGGMEAALTFSLVALGAPLATALLGVIAYRVFAFWLPTLPALAVLPTLPRVGRDIEQAVS
jgi:uncharacterized membrane protein YbhN (UPF0104 family)